MGVQWDGVWFQMVRMPMAQEEDHHPILQPGKREFSRLPEALVAAVCIRNLGEGGFASALREIRAMFRIETGDGLDQARLALYSFDETLTFLAHGRAIEHADRRKLHRQAQRRHDANQQNHSVPRFQSSVRPFRRIPLVIRPTIKANMK